MLVNRCGIDFVVTEGQNNTFWNIYNWEQDTYTFLQKFSDPEKIFIDIGAWIGPISLPATKLNKMCYALEPDPIAYKELQTNINLNNIDNIKSYNLAMFNVNGFIKMGSEVLGSSVTSIGSNINTFDVKCITMSCFIEENNINQNEISLIKIDVEGSETEILKDDFFRSTEVPVHLSLHGPYFKNKVEDSSIIIEFINRYKNKVGVVDFDCLTSIMLYN